MIYSYYVFCVLLFFNLFFFFFFFFQAEDGIRDRTVTGVQTCALPICSPIVAPFDGYATTGRSKLGGLEVRVFGADGYIYDAHLSRLGSLGYVNAGDVVGYVGSTGDATDRKSVV